MQKIFIEVIRHNRHLDLGDSSNKFVTTDLEQFLERVTNLSELVGACHFTLAPCALGCTQFQK